VSRDELTNEARAELAALDRILARDQVDEEHLELAALVDSVRADAPRMDDGFRARLEQTLARRRRRPVRAPRDLALAGCALAAAAVALAIVLSSGLLGAAGGADHSNRAAPSSSRVRAAAPAIKHGPGQSFASSGPASTAAPASSPASTPAPARLVRRASTLVLATPAPRIQHVSNAIVADTERQSGIVASSSVSLAGSTTRASFSLRVPAAHLPALIGALSSLAGVRSLSQQTNDITLHYDRERALLARERVLRRKLLAEIAAAPTAARAATLRRELGSLERRMSVHRHLIADARSSAATAHLAVSVIAATPHRHHSAAGPIAGAFGTALRELSALLAIALVVLAIVVPSAVTALALWWAATIARQRARERALRAAQRRVLYAGPPGA
jgi:Domain of unknown function (DUF4349)